MSAALLRPMESGDLDAVERIELASFSVPWSRKSLRLAMESELSAYGVACLDGSVVGYAGLSYVLDEGCIDTIAVDPAQRGHGVATLLMRWLFAQAQGLGLRRLTLEVRPSNREALALYRAFGFVQEGRRTGYYTKPPEDALILSCRDVYKPGEVLYNELRQKQQP